MTICERMFLLIDAAPNKSAAGLCKVLGVGTSQTSNWKSRNADPPARYLQQISEYLEVSIEYLVTGEEKECDTHEGQVLQTGEILDDGEVLLLTRFRSLDSEGKEEVLHAALSEVRRMRAEQGEGAETAIAG